MSLILGEHISAIVLPQQCKQWLSIESNRWHSEVIHCYIFNNKKRTLIILMSIWMIIITKLLFSMKHGIIIITISRDDQISQKLFCHENMADTKNQNLLVCYQHLFL